MILSEYEYSGPNIGLGYIKFDELVVLPNLIMPATIINEAQWMGLVSGWLRWCYHGYRQGARNTINRKFS